MPALRPAHLQRYPDVMREFHVVGDVVNNNRHRLLAYANPRGTANQAVSNAAGPLVVTGSTISWSGPAIPKGHIIECSFGIWAAGGTVDEWYFDLEANLNGAGYALLGNVRYSPVTAALNAPSPMGHMSFTLAADASSISARWKCSLLTAAAAGTLYLGQSDTQKSWFKMVDLGVPG